MIAFRIDGDHVQTEELAAVFAHAAHLADDFAVFAVKEPDVVIGQIGNIQEPLLLVGREHHAASGAAHAGHRRQDEFVQELALLGGDVDAVGHAIRGVDQAVVGNVQREVAAEFLGLGPPGV